MKKIVISYKFLYEEYINKKKSMDMIAKEIGTTAMTIYNRLKEHNISRRNSWDMLIGKKRPEHSKKMKEIYSDPKKCHKYIDGRSNKDNFCICGNRIVSYRAKKCPQCHYDYLKIHFKGRKTNPTKKFFYNNIWMRSSWEVKYAQYLDLNKTKWMYEPKMFDLGINGYIPDFYLTKTNEYIEIKGFWRKDSFSKFKLFKEKYPNIKIKVLSKIELKKERII